MRAAGAVYLPHLRLLQLADLLLLGGDLQAVLLLPILRGRLHDYERQAPVEPPRQAHCPHLPLPGWLHAAQKHDHASLLD